MHICTYVHVICLFVLRTDMHVCTYVYIHVCTYVYIHVCTYVYMHVCTYVYIHVCMYVCSYLCTYECYVMYVCVSLQPLEGDGPTLVRGVQSKLQQVHVHRLHTHILPCAHTLMRTHTGGCCPSSAAAEAALVSTPSLFQGARAERSALTPGRGVWPLLHSLR